MADDVAAAKAVLVRELSFIELLEKPSLLETAPVSLRNQVLEVVRAHAPRYWFHSDDEGPSDPLRFLSASSLWFRLPGSGDARLAGPGDVDPAELVHIWSNSGPARPSDSPSGGGVFLKLESQSGRKPASVDWTNAPMLWRLGRKIRDDLFLIEYWFHSDHNRGGLLGIGDHQGDWEGVSALIKVRFSDGPEFAHWLVAMYFASHEGGSWQCAQDLEWSGDTIPRPEAFSAHGSHASYPRPGKHWNRFYQEHAPRGKPWDGWKNLRPLVLEPYFGYSGGWGDSHRLSFLSFMSGPMPPCPFKRLPREIHDASWFSDLEARCRPAQILLCPVASE